MDLKHYSKYSTEKAGIKLFYTFCKAGTKPNGGMGIGHPPTLIIIYFAGQNGSSMYFCRAAYLTLDQVLLLKKVPNKNLQLVEILMLDYEGGEGKLPWWHKEISFPIHLLHF